MRRLRWVRGLAGRRRHAADGIVAVITGLVCVVPMTGRSEVRGYDGPRAVDFVFLAVLLVPLVWRRTAPVLAFWTVFGLAWLTDVAGADLPALLIVPMVAIYAVARYRPLRFLWAPVLAIEATVVSLGLTDDTRWEVIGGITAALAATVLFGVNGRTRRAYLAELEERAVRLARERDQQAELAAAAERARIARELHDIVAHNLAVMIALADGAVYNATVAPDKATDAMTKVSSTGREALGEMRRLLGLLREPPASVPVALSGPVESTFSSAGDENLRPIPPAQAAGLSPQPGLAEVDRLIGQVREAGMRVVLTTEGMPGDWGAGAELAVYRILQEALTNALKHAGPDAVTHVRLRYSHDRAELEVTDDGARRPNGVREETTQGLGVAGMAERAEAYGGQLAAGPRPQGGWRVHVELRFDEVVA